MLGQPLNDSRPNEKASRSLLGRLALLFSLIAGFRSLLKEGRSDPSACALTATRNLFQFAGCSEPGRRKGRRASSSTL